MQDDPRYDDVVDDVKAFLEERLASPRAPACAEERDPARPGHRLRQDARAQPRAAAPARRDRRARPPVVIGTSRKSFLGRLTGRDVTGACTGRWPRTCSARARGACSASTTSPPVRDALAVAAATLRAMASDDRRGLRRRRAERRRTRTTRAPTVGSPSRSSGSRSTPTTASPRPSGRSGSAWCSTCASTSARSTRLITDKVEDTVDYGEVCQVIALIAQQRSYKTLERLCAVIADRLLAVRRRERHRQGRQARAADPAARRGGLGRGLARRGVLEVLVSDHRNLLAMATEPRVRKSAEERREEILEVAVRTSRWGPTRHLDRGDRPRGRHLQPTCSGSSAPRRSSSSPAWTGPTSRCATRSGGPPPRRPRTSGSRRWARPTSTSCSRTVMRS